MDENKYLFALSECISALKHCRRTLEVIMENKNNPNIVARSALDTEVYLQITFKTLRDLGLGQVRHSDRL